MSVTVVLRLQARPGQVGALLAAGAALYRQALQTGQLQEVRVLQGLADPDSVLVLGEWETREAYWTARQQDQAGDAMVALCAGPPQRAFCERLGYYEDMSRRAVVAAAAFIGAPAGSAAALARYLSHEGRQLILAAPGLVYRYVYRHADDPGRFLTSIGLASESDWEQFQQRHAPAIQAALVARDATLEPFVGRAHTDADRYGTSSR